MIFLALDSVDKQIKLVFYSFNATVLRHKPMETTMAKVQENHWEGYSIDQIIDAAAVLAAEAKVIESKLKQAKEIIRKMGKNQSHMGNLFIACVEDDTISFRIDRKRLESEMGKDWVEDYMEGFYSDARVTFNPAPVRQ